MYIEKDNQSKKILIFLLIFSLTLSYYIDLGFALKPYMIVSAFTALIFLGKIEFIKLRAFEVFFLIFCFYYSLTGVFSEFVYSSLRMILGILIFVTCYFIMRYIIYKANISTIEKSIAVVGIIFNAISLALYIIGFARLNFVFFGNGFRSLGVMMDRDLPRLIGTFHDPNFFCLVNLLFFYYYLTHLNKNISRIGLALTTLTLLLTLSRGAIIAIVLGMVLLFFTIKISSKIKMLLIIPLSVYAISLLTSYFFKVDFVKLIVDRFSSSEGDAGSGRFNIWDNAISVFEQNPIFGIGIFNWREYNLAYFGEASYMHNSFLEVLVESGIIGLILFVSVFFLLILEYLKTRKSGVDGRYLFLTLFSVIIMMNSLSMTFHESFLFLLVLFSRYLYEMNIKTAELKKSGIAT